MSTETKNRIIACGAELIHRKGFNNTGIKEILDAAEVPKGSFYFYFKNKEDFGLAVIDFYSERFNQRCSYLLSDKKRSPLERFELFFIFFENFFAESEYSLGCPIGNLSQEMGGLSTAFQNKLEKAMQGLTNYFYQFIEQAKEQNELPEELNAEETALFLVEAWHGALIRMKTLKSGYPLEVCRKLIFNKVLKT